MSTTTKNIMEIIADLQSKGVKQQLGHIGKPLVYEPLTPSGAKELQVDSLYQRLISPNKINSYGTFNWSLCIPVVVSRRPESLGSIHKGNFVIDGQNKVVKYILSGTDDALPVVVLEHDSDSDYDTVLKSEAALFNQLNTWIKKLDTIDNLRSEVCFGDEFAIHVENSLKTLNLRCVPNTFGSDSKDAFDLKSFTHFYYCVKDDYNTNSTGICELQKAYEFWKKIYIDTPTMISNNLRTGEKAPVIANHVNGSTFRAVAHLYRFIEEGLNNGKQTEFRKWCVGNIAKYWRQDKLIKGFSGFQLPRWTLDRIIDRYNEEITDSDGRGAQTLGPVTLYEASRVDEKFKSPDEDRWNKVVADYRKTLQ